jgi:Cu+-exporting ATPase
MKEDAGSRESGSPRRDPGLDSPAPAVNEETVYTCPMHPQIEQDHPGACPICGMALEPKGVPGKGAEDNAELRDMTRRFYFGAGLLLPVLLLAMGHFTPWWARLADGPWSGWAEFLFSTPVVLWAGRPFFVKGGAFPGFGPLEHVHLDFHGGGSGLRL